MAIYNGRILIRKGNEADFDPSKMMAGEWAVSLDKGIVRICLQAGKCIRMATYEAFEEDMQAVENILLQCKTIQEAVSRINTEVSQKLNAVAEYVEQAKSYRNEAKAFRDEAEQFKNEAFNTTPQGYEELKNQVNTNTVKIDTVIEKADLRIKETASGESIHLTDSADAKVVEFGLYGNATQDGTPSPDNEVDIDISGASGSVGVKSCGKNLLKNTAESATADGLTVTINEDKSVKITGSLATAQIKDVYINGSYGGTKNILPIKKGKIFIKDTVVPQNPNVIMHVITPGSKVLGTTNGQDLSLEIENGITAIMYRFSAGVTYDLTLYPMIRACDENGNSIGDDTYEPYKETTATIPTPNGLAGINVDSGGNYTDENGQQWICDEIVKYADGSGEYIQRVGKRTITSISGINGITNTFVNYTSFYTEYFYDRKRNSHPTTGLCNYATFYPYFEDNEICIGKCSFNPNSEYFNFFYINISKETLGVSASDDTTMHINAANSLLAENPITVYYELAEPIRTPLTAEQIAEIEKLCTFYPVTNIFNDADCGMKATYIVDAKKYIDNKIAELATAMVNNI